MIDISLHGQALLALNKEWEVENMELIRLQKMARQLANQITNCQRKQAALQQTMARIIIDHGKPVYTAADL